MEVEFTPLGVIKTAFNFRALYFHVGVHVGASVSVYRLRTRVLVTMQAFVWRYEQLPHPMSRITNSRTHLSHLRSLFHDPRQSTDSWAS